MNFLRLVPASTLILFALIALGSLHAQTVFDDSFADGNRAETNTGGEDDTSWWTSSSSAADEINIGPPNTLGLVTGTSGRGLHTVFPTQTLANVGDKLTATYTFTTPATVGAGSSAAFRVGLFDTLGRAGLNADVDSSSGTPNALYGWSVGNGGPGDPGLPGYMLDMDVNTGSSADLNFRTHNVGSATGRLMQTTGSGSFSSLSSGPDEGYTFAPNTSYTGSFSIERISPTELQLTGTLDGASYTLTDTTFTSTSFGLLGFHVNGDQFGSSNSAGQPDNGIDFSNINVTSTTGAGIVLGDANDDGVITNDDILPFVQALTMPAVYAVTYPGVDPDVVLDMNGDGVFDNNDILRFVEVLTGGTGGENSGPQEFLVSTAAEIESILSELDPGDTIVMTNGTWTNQEIEFAAIGSEESPITLRAQTPGLVVLNGDSSLEISGDWLVVDGLRFEGGALESGSIVQFRGSLGHATNSRFTNSSILNYNPPDQDTRYFWVSIYGQHNRVDHNYFYNQDHSGVTVVVWRDTPDPDFHTIDGNHFTDRPVGNGNGFETIRIGTSTESESESFSVVEDNLFERVDGEIEIISNKSGGNIFRHNTFRESAGTLTLRHGHGNLVDANFFLGFGKDGSGGVRVIGENQTVVNNYFWGLDGRADGAIAITAGVPDSPLNGYPQVKNAVIAHNTIVDVNDAAIVFSQGLGSSGRTLLADDVIIANNAIYSEQDPLFEGNEGSNWSWHGNIAFGQSLGPASGNLGIQVVDPMLQPDATAIWRPQTGSPLVDSAIGDYSTIARFDMDGQERVGVFDIGADESFAGDITKTPLTGADVGPPLVVLLSPDTVDESDGPGAATATVVRNKNSSDALTVTITNSDSSEIQTPTTVTIPANQNSVDFAIDAIDDTIGDGTQTVTITAAASGHPEGVAILSVTDDD